MFRPNLIDPSSQISPRDFMGRQIHKIRIQITDACNFRCFYCMPEASKFLPASTLLSPMEIGKICAGLFHLGIDEARVTGGEPTVRPEFDSILGELAKIPWRKFGLTTNGYLLADKLPLLRDLGCQHINISLDSLVEEKFNAITRRAFFKPVMASILKAVSMGFKVKVNSVIARGYNETELLSFLRFSEQHGIEVRFLELMKVGSAITDHSEKFITAQEMRDELLKSEDLIAESSPLDSTSFGFRTQGGARIGFIASESQPFCGTCSRLRLTATGKLRACLFSEAGVDLRNRDPLDYPEILHEVMNLKPTGRLEEVFQSMNQIGG